MEASQNIIENIYGLTPMQAGMLYHRMLDDDPQQYFLQQCVRVTGEAREDFLEMSLSLLSARHDVLRTCFVTPKSTGKPRQVLLRERKPEFSSLDLRGESSDSREQALDQLKKADLVRGFDLEKDSLLRAALVRMADQEYVLIWSIHHLIVDGWSMPILFGDFLGYYSQLLQGRSYDALLDEAREQNQNSLRFADYPQWLREKDEAASLAYWQNLLDGYEQTADIPPLHPAAPGRDTVGTASAALDEASAAALRSLSASHGITLSTVLETAWGLLLHRYNNSGDAVFGKVVSGRNADLPGIEGMAGLFINTVPVRVRLEGSPTLLKLLQNQQRQALESDSHSHCSLSQVQKQSALGVSLFRTLFAFENFPISRSAQQSLPGIEFSTESFREQTSYPISLKTSDSDSGGIAMELLYDPGLYLPAEMNLLLSRYLTLLKNMAQCPDADASGLAYLSEGERESLLCEFNAPLKEYCPGKTAVDLFEEQVAARPGKEALLWEDETLTYSQLNAKANRLAHKLREMGIGRDDFVALVCNRGPRMIAGILGVLKAGGAYLPIDPTLPENRIRFMLEDCGVKAVLFADAQLPFSTGLPLLDLGDEQSLAEEDYNPPPVATPDNLAYCIYTSGTTGMPKGVLIRHRGVVNLCLNFRDLGLDHTDRVVQFANATFDASVWEIFTALLLGGALCLVPADLILNPKELGAYLRQQNATAALFPPQYYLQNPLPGLRTIVTGGTASSREVVRRASATSRYFNAYGPTETTVVATVWQHRSGQRIPSSIPIGKPLRNCPAYVLQGTSLCGVGIPGELCVGGVGVARGYGRRPELTEEKFMENPFGEGRLYRTGDLARWLPDGNLEYLGRIDDQVKIRGFRIEPGEIEATLRGYPGVRDALVIHRQDPRGDPALYAYLVLKAERSLDDLRPMLEKDLPAYMIPSYMTVLESIPLNRSGKPDKNALPDIRPDQDTPPSSPRTDQESRIASVFREVLGLRRVGVNQDFFELGGDSLKAIQIVSRLDGDGLTISVKDVFKLRSVEKIADKLSAGLGISRGAPEPEPPAASPETDNPSDNTDALLADIDRQMAAYAAAIQRRPLWNPRPLSAPQMLSLRVGVLGSFGRIEVNRPWEPEAFAAVWNQLLREFPLLKSSIRANEKGGHMLEYTGVRVDKIPFVDLSPCGSQKADQLLHRISNHIRTFDTLEQYRGCHVVHRLLCVKTSPQRYVALIPVSHLVFDAFSNEILVHRFFELYGGGEAAVSDRSGYADYLRLLARGPEETTQGEIIKALQLGNFCASLNAHRLTKKLLPRTCIDFVYTLKDENLGPDRLVSLAESVVLHAWQFTYPGKKIPLLLLHSGRNYRNHNFSNQVGEFIDVLPVVLDTNDDGGILESCRAPLAFVREHNINIAALFHDRQLRARYPIINLILSQIHLEDLDIQILNLVVMYQSPLYTEEREGEAHRATPLRENTNSEAFLNVTLSGNRLIFQNIECTQGREARLRRHLLAAADRAVGLPE